MARIIDMDEFSMRVTGGFFVAAAAMLWLGRVLLPHPIGEFFVREDFARVRASYRRWIWMFRIHLFGFLVGVMALVALATLVNAPQGRVLLWPGVMVGIGGLFVASLASAFYYHFGAWGALDMEGEPPEAIDRFVESLRPTTEYVTCFVRFGRVFFGLGQVVIACGLLQAGFLPVWVGLGAAALGVAAMALTMGFPNNLEYGVPVFHANAIWLASTGLAVFAAAGAPA